METTMGVLLEAYGKQLDLEIKPLEEGMVLISKNGNLVGQYLVAEAVDFMRGWASALDELARDKDKWAAAAHELWCEWMKYMLSRLPPSIPGPGYRLSVIDYDNWYRLMKTSFETLTDKEKKSDYEVAEKYLIPKIGSVL